MHTFIVEANAAGLNLDENDYRSKMSSLGSGRDVCRTGLMTYVDLAIDFRTMDGGSVNKGAAHNAVLNYCDAANKGS
ncbi:hypothetical protein [Amycolatopsis benzoatilytica]|uniref:hypothetical protein n=1 Tax=Amycolatopsis benzoatilytica TaxID=346045 RepID=UPI000379512E|nr:hypothetical protein [Amycolatopsis benzoatilytica]